MQVQKSTLQKVTAIITITVLIIIGMILIMKPSNQEELIENIITMENGKQIINLKAKAGYSPMYIEAMSEVETILRVSTKNTFDCSSALLIPSLDVQKNLPANGDTDITIVPQKAGTEIDGTCSMGMYNFKIKFI